MPLASRSEFDVNGCARGHPSCDGSPDRPPGDLAALRRMRTRTATYAGLCRPGYAAPSGFLNLLTRYSTLAPSGLVSCRWRPWASTFSGFPSAVASIASRRSLSPVPLLRPDRGQVGRDFEDLRTRGVRCTAPVLPGEQRPIRSWLFPLRGLHLVGFGCRNDPATSFFGLQHDARRPKSPIAMPAL
jgi:hypothetical protein